MSKKSGLPALLGERPPFPDTAKTEKCPEESRA